MNILERIVAQKRTEVERKKMLYPIKLLEQSAYFSSPIVSLSEYLIRKDKSGIIAEIKRGSPSRGMINKHISVEQTSIGYMQAGASALSVLTDEPFFFGTNQDLVTARQFNYCPILRKDFVIDEYQIVEARSIGADAILLIASILTEEQVFHFTSVAKSLQLAVILEVHNAQELQQLNDDIDIVGVNNRNLETFVTDVERSIEMYPLIPDQFIKVSESGIHTPEIACRLRIVGYEGFLIGEHFMSTSRPGVACAEFIQRLNELYATESLRTEGMVQH